MDDEEEKLFLERLANRVWKAWREGAAIGAGCILGVGFLLYLAVEAGPLNLMSAFLYAGIGVMTYTLWSKVLKKP